MESTSCLDGRCDFTSLPPEEVRSKHFFIPEMCKRRTKNVSQILSLQNPILAANSPRHRCPGTFVAQSFCLTSRPLTTKSSGGEVFQRVPVVSSDSLRVHLGGLQQRQCIPAQCPERRSESQGKSLREAHAGDCLDSQACLKLSRFDRLAHWMSSQSPLSQHLPA